MPKATKSALNLADPGCGSLKTSRSRPSWVIRAAIRAYAALVAQWIEHRFPKPCAQVRFLPGAQFPEPPHRLGAVFAVFC